MTILQLTNLQLTVGQSNSSTLTTSNAARLQRAGDLFNFVGFQRIAFFDVVIAL